MAINWPSNFKNCQENIVSGTLFVKSELKQSFQVNILIDGFNKALLTKKLFSTFSDWNLLKLYSSWWIAMDSLLVLVQLVSVSGLHYNWQYLFSWNFIAIQRRIQNSVKHLRWRFFAKIVNGRNFHLTYLTGL